MQQQAWQGTSKQGKCLCKHVVETGQEVAAALTVSDDGWEGGDGGPVLHIKHEGRVEDLIAILREAGGRGAVWDCGPKPIRAVEASNLCGFAVE